MNKRRTILNKIDNILNGDVFDVNSLMETNIQRTDVAFVLHELKKEKIIKRIAAGLYYKPKKSILGLGDVAVSKDKLIEYYSRKYDSHLSGEYGFNSIGITEQCAFTITLAGRRRFKPFKVENYYFDYSCSPIGEQRNQKNLRLTIFLDALQNIYNISGVNSADVIDYSKKFIANLDKTELDELQKQSVQYPTRVKYLLASLLNEVNIDNDLMSMVTNKSLYDKIYQNTLHSSAERCIR